MRALYLSVAAVALLGACTATTPQEKLVDSSPSWYLEPPHDDGMLYASGMSVSPDLQFAVDKALLQAKSGLADRVRGETSVLSRSHAVQNGNTVTRSDDKTVKNIAKDVNLGGFEIVKSQIIPDVGSYRAYVLLKYVPASGDSLDKSVGILDQTHVTGSVPAAPTAPTAPPAATEAPVAPLPAAPRVPVDRGEL